MKKGKLTCQVIGKDGTVCGHECGNLMHHIDEAHPRSH